MRTELLQTTSAYAALCRDCKENRRKHAYVLQSSDFDALFLLAALFVSLSETGEADAFMLRRMADGGYTDVITLPRAEKNGKMDVEEAGYLTDTAYLRPTELTAKYYIIAPREPMGEAVQNKLLKTLEEPPLSSRFLLFSSGSDLLPTVRSRCAAVPLEPFPVEVIEQELIRAGYDRTDAVFAAAVARGNIGTAEKVAADKGYRAAYESAMNFLLCVKRSPQILPAASEVIADKERIPAFIDYLELILRDVTALQAVGADGVVLTPAMRDLNTLARELDTRTCLALSPLLTRARARLRLYGNAASIVDELLFSILEVKAKCLKS